jgi:type I restriction enzyme S subunit
MISAGVRSIYSDIPPGWRVASLQTILRRVRKPVEVEADTLYREIGIYSHGRGIFHKEERTGKSLGNKRVYWVEPDCFVVNIVFAWERAVAKTTTEERGMIASHRFPMYRPKKGILDLNYLVYYFNSPQGKYLLGLASPGGAGRNRTLGQQAFLDLSIPLPPYPEQRKIADILRMCDRAIILTEQRIQAAEQRRKALLQQLFTGKRRFAEFVESQETQDTNLGWYPQEWEIRRLTEVTYIRFSNVDKKHKPSEQSVFLCNYTDVFNNDYIHSGLHFMEASATIGEVGKFTLRKDDVIITKDSETREEIAEPCVVTEDLENVICGYHLAILRPMGGVVSGFFLKDVLRSSSVHRQFVKQANGVTRFGLTQAAVRNALVPVPSIEEQRKIAAVFRICDREIELFTQKRDALQRQKKGLMQRLLTGRVRVRV